LKAEVFSADFIIGLSVFLIITVILGVFYINLQTDISDYKSRSDIQTKANNVADILITSSGDPEYWDSSNVNVIGFYDSGLLNLTKFEELKNIEYYTAKRLMGVGGYEIYIELENETGYVLKNDSITYSFGKPIEDASQVSYMKRLGLTNLNGNITKTILGVAIWI
jgi:hypothetical protein